MQKLFGTDGVRGIANEDLTPELAFKIGRTGAYILSEHGDKKGKIIVGTDTRRSKDMLTNALVAGITSTGIDAVVLGVVPTPAVSYITRAEKALGGVVISASHNPAEYNGIKFFGADGYKLGDKRESELEEIISKGMEEIKSPIKGELGVVEEIKDGYREYIDYLKTTVDVDFKGLKIALDCGNGAVYKAAPLLLEELNAEVVVINDEPDGLNINLDCGSTNPEKIRDLVLETKSDLGLSFDGDADRLIAVDEKGVIMNGDHILAVAGTYLSEKGKLKDDVVVGTIMTNMGLDDYLNSNSMKIVKTNVGDKYVIDEMLKKGYTLGGEQSGHIIFLEHNNTGDGLLSGIQLIQIMKETGKKMSELNNLMKDYNQILVNARVKKENKYKYLEDEEIKKEIEKVEDIFKGQGRVVIRPSGTEPLVRVMIECKEGKDLEQIAKDLAVFIEAKLG